MRFRSAAGAVCLLAGVTISLLTSCGKVVMPRLTHEPSSSGPQIPIVVKLEFDEALQKATLQQTVCADTLWEGKLGQSIMRAFDEEAQDRFRQVLIGPNEQSNVKPTLTVQLHLQEKSFTQLNRTGEEEQYRARLDVTLLSTYLDSAGQPITEGPLTYSNNVGIWTPRVGFGTRNCLTDQLDEAVTKAAKFLAQQMTGVMTAIVTKNPVPARTPMASQPGGSPALAMPSQLSSAPDAALTLKATLTDDNKNQTIEPGEKLTLRIDATNTGTGPIATVPLTLSGTPGIVEAFGPSLSAGPILLGPVPPGETRSTIISGRMPASIQESRAELTLSTAPEGGVATTPVTVLAAVQGSMSSQAKPGLSTASPVQPLSSTAGFDRQANRYAVIVGIDLYRTPWPGAQSNRPDSAEEVISFFRTALGVPDDHILLLQDELAARDDIEDALAKWLPKRIGSDSVVFLYFGGHAAVDGKTGEVSLLPFDATPTSSPVRWVSLRLLQGRLKKLGAQLTIAIVDASVNVASSPHSAKPAPSRPSVQADWSADLDNGAAAKGPVLQIVSPRATGKIPASLQVLSNDADLDHDGIVTVGEWLRALRGKALVAPTLPPTLAIQSIPLTRVNHHVAP